MTPPRNQKSSIPANIGIIFCTERNHISGRTHYVQISTDKCYFTLMLLWERTFWYRISCDYTTTFLKKKEHSGTENVVQRFLLERKILSSEEEHNIKHES